MIFFSSKRKAKQAAARVVFFWGTGYGLWGTEAIWYFFVTNLKKKSRKHRIPFFGIQGIRTG